MPKTIESPVKEFAGTIVLPDMLILPQVLAWDDANILRDEINERWDAKEKHTLSERKKFLGELNAVYLPSVLQIVLEWHIDKIPANPAIADFPLTPRIPSASFIAWILGEIRKIYEGEIEVPNA